MARVEQINSEKGKKLTQKKDTESKFNDQSGKAV
jgi:hypothetical protein